MSNKYCIGDKVVLKKASNASLNLYMKAKQSGMSYVKCPCNAKTGFVFEIKAAFANGFFLTGVNNSLSVVAHPNDIRSIENG